MTRPRGPDPADVIERTCRNNPGLDPALLAKKILADLKGHGLRIVVDHDKTIAYCGGDCIRTQLVGGRCPICGWRPNQ